jgi:hypothetical protein
MGWVRTLGADDEAAKHRLMTRHRSGCADNAGEEFDEAFTRLDHVEESLDEKRFDIMGHRHPGERRRLHSSVALEEALRPTGTNGILRPPP